MHWSAGATPSRRPHFAALICRDQRMGSSDGTTPASWQLFRCWQRIHRCHSSSLTAGVHASRDHRAPAECPFDALNLSPKSRARSYTTPGDAITPSISQVLRSPNPRIPYRVPGEQTAHHQQLLLTGLELTNDAFHGRPKGSTRANISSLSNAIRLIAAALRLTTLDIGETP